jgi:hypothetical protein
MKLECKTGTLDKLKLTVDNSNGNSNGNSNYSNNRAIKFPVLEVAANAETN